MNRKKKIRERKMIQIPVDTEIYKFLENNDDLPYWKRLEQILNQFPKTKDDRSVLIFEEFVEKISELCPECKEQLEFLRPLILRRFMKKETLEPWYYEGLMKL